MTRSLKGRIGFSQSSVDERERGGWPHKSEAAERGTGPLVSSNLKPVVCIRSVIAVVGARLTHDGGGAWPCCVYRGHPSRPRALRSVGRRLRAGHAGRYPRLPLGPCTAPARPGGRRARGRSGVTAFGFAPRRPTARGGASGSRRGGRSASAVCRTGAGRERPL